jgi:glutamate-1-semialdehyde 2,1-aminomutase
VSAGPESKAWFERAREVLPGGVNSPVRAYGAVGGEPLVIAHAHGTTITDVDGRSYLDFVGSWGPLILGHAHPAVIWAIETTARGGTSYGAPCRPEIELA